ncbi:hypothetical protein [Lysinibacillus fusiformis]|uniref:hypothetical protein n=1 Tax=Lysinibacillus fusiformis TaxID=28031 RepID=UPI002E1F6367|nr:hypothetical protein [Lysinibacillus fusiformis]
MDDFFDIFKRVIRTLAKENGAAEVAKDYFNSKYNHPDVMTKGIFKDGSNPFKK